MAKLTTNKVNRAKLTNEYIFNGKSINEISNYG
jgi:hypothetical protein